MTPVTNTPKTLPQEPKRNMTIIRICFIAICLLGVLGLIFMTLGFYQKVHPMTGVALLCSTLIPLSLICSYQGS